VPQQRGIRPVRIPSGSDNGREWFEGTADVAALGRTLQGTGLFTSDVVTDADARDRSETTTTEATGRPIRAYDGRDALRSAEEGRRAILQVKFAPSPGPRGPRSSGDRASVS
jgi:hypothetical protein